MCVDHVGAGEFTTHFSPGDPRMPESRGEGGPGVSNDWCIIKLQKQSTVDPTKVIYMKSKIVLPYNHCCALILSADVVNVMIVNRRSAQLFQQHLYC